MSSSSTNVAFSILFLVVTSDIFIMGNKRKKNMGNCISKINKDHFFYFSNGDEKCHSFFSRERQGVSLQCVPEVKNIQEFIP